MVHLELLGKICSDVQIRAHVFTCINHDVRTTVCCGSNGSGEFM